MGVWPRNILVGPLFESACGIWPLFQNEALSIIYPYMQALTEKLFSITTRLQGIISKLNDAKKDKIISSGREGVGIDIISISSFIIFLASQ